jgi:predicted SAM-dependent methyltransferase
VNLNLCSGPFPIKGCINADLRKYPGVDVVCDVRNLPFKKESFDKAIFIHAIEHFDKDEGISVLKDMADILKSNGEITVEGPDVAKCITNFSNPAQSIEWIFGSSKETKRDKAYRHKWGYTGTLVASILNHIGMDVKVVTVGRSHNMPNRDYRVTGRKNGGR